MLSLGLAAGRSEALVIKCEGVQVDGEQRWRLTDVVGEEDGLGIECLSGSGAIARYAAPSTCSLLLLAPPCTLAATISLCINNLPCLARLSC